MFSGAFFMAGFFLFVIFAKKFFAELDILAAGEIASLRSQ
jgi:hypothetical protein